MHRCGRFFCQRLREQSGFIWSTITDNTRKAKFVNGQSSFIWFWIMCRRSTQSRWMDWIRCIPVASSLGFRMVPTCIRRAFCRKNWSRIVPAPGWNIWWGALNTLQMHSMVHISSTRNSLERCQFGGCQREHTICCAQSTMSGRNMQGKIILHISTKVLVRWTAWMSGFQKDHICIRCGFKMARKSARDCRQRKSIFRFFGPMY